MEQQWLAWAEQLQSIAQAGLEYSKDKFDLERFARIRELSVEILNSYTEVGIGKLTDLFANETGYQTPKVDTRAVVPRGGKLLFVQESDDGKWALPGGWAEIQLSLKENVEKEVREESGIIAEAHRLIAVLDRNRYTDDDYPYSVYKIFVECRAVDGSFKPNTETTDARFFGEGELPELSALRNTESQVAMCFAFLRGTERQVVFD
ncbi:MAG: NUDIX hydrolase [Spirochaetaceae bacterium]|nr:NUDIX hydrolase [Spirochaetaceae bacterium]